jgi:ATP-dependent Clp protease ATP-binding subunit ClpA
MPIPSGKVNASVRGRDKMDTRVQHILALGNLGRETDRARHCIALGIECADELGDREFDSGHLLSGLYREGNGVAYHILKNFAVSQHQIDDALRSRHRSTPDEFQINNEMQVVLQSAFAAARGMSHHYIGTEHLLIGVTSETVAAAKMLLAFGLSPNEVRMEVYNLLGRGLG